MVNFGGGNEVIGIDVCKRWWVDLYVGFGDVEVSFGDVGVEFV